MMNNGVPRADAHGYRNTPTILMVIVGPLVGLAYVIALPCIGAGIIAYLCGCRALHGIGRIWHRFAPRTVGG